MLQTAISGYFSLLYFKWAYTCICYCVCLIHTDTSVGDSLVPRMTFTNVWSIGVLAVGVCTTVLPHVLTFIDIFVTVWSCPAFIQSTTRRTADDFVTLGTSADHLTVLTPATGRTRCSTITTSFLYSIFILVYTTRRLMWHNSTI